MTRRHQNEQLSTYIAIHCRLKQSRPHSWNCNCFRKRMDFLKQFVLIQVYSLMQKCFRPIYIWVWQRIIWSLGLLSYYTSQASSNYKYLFQVVFMLVRRPTWNRKRAYSMKRLHYAHHLAAAAATAALSMQITVLQDHSAARTQFDIRWENF